MVDHAAVAPQQIMLTLAILESQYPSSTFNIRNCTLSCIHTAHQHTVSMGCCVPAHGGIKYVPDPRTERTRRQICMQVRHRLQQAHAFLVNDVRLARLLSVLHRLLSPLARLSRDRHPSKKCRVTCMAYATSTALLVLLSMEWPDEHIRRGPEGTPRQPGTAPASAPGSSRRP